MINETVWNVRTIRQDAGPGVRGYQATTFKRHIRNDGIPIWKVGEARGPLFPTHEEAKRYGYKLAFPHDENAAGNRLAMGLEDIVFDKAERAAVRLRGGEGLAIAYTNGRERNKRSRRYAVGLARQGTRMRYKKQVDVWTLIHRIGTVSRGQLGDLFRLAERHGLTELLVQVMPRMPGKELRPCE